MIKNTKIRTALLVEVICYCECVLGLTFGTFGSGETVCATVKLALSEM
jgi:hypothetical protein